MAGDYDVVVVGAGPAGSAAGIFLARNGLRVALLESHKDLNHYKRLCSHSIRGGTLPTIKRLGIAQALDELGAVRHHENVWTKHGWFHERTDQEHHGYNVQRATLDPFLRTTAVALPALDLMMGARVRELTTDRSGRFTGVVADVSGDQRRIGARLVVGADGYSSKVATLAKLPGRRWANIRCGYLARYRNVGVPVGWSGAIWLQEPDITAFLCNDDGVTVLVVFPAKDRLTDFGDDREAALLGMFTGLSNGPDLSRAQRVSDVIGTTDYPSITRRRIVAPGVALIGDAAMVGDPLWGTGCGWALQTAEWLSDAVSQALRSGSNHEIDAAACRYQRRHRHSLLPHQAMNIDFSRRRRFNTLERLLFAAAARDQMVADRVAAVATRKRSPLSLFTPALLTRAGVLNRKPAASA
jgi:2-polyprenyl-6-methoxyphenol hydroxylase-like FAD-dependent oxidoreductase